MRTSRPALAAVLSLAVLAPLASLGCSSSSERVKDAPSPLAPSEAALKADHDFYAFRTSGAERVVQAVFGPLATGEACTAEIVAGCEIWTCDPVDRATQKGAGDDPGAVTVESVTLGGSLPVTLTEGVGRIVQSGLWNEHEAVHLKVGGGADYPAFEETVTLPDDLSDLKLDGCNATAESCALSDEGATLTWSGAKGARVKVTVASSVTDARHVGLACSYDGTEGRGWLPREAIARLAGESSLKLRPTIFDAAPRVHAGAKHAARVYGARWPSGVQTLSISLK